MSGMRMPEATNSHDGRNTQRERLIDLACRYWAMPVDVETLPRRLQRRHERLTRRLFTGGTIRRSIRLMDDAALRETAADLRALAGSIVEEPIFA
ncbi:MAG: hypothetical protein KY476_24495 [Planctomycetes bacterium]|nr:hypothetical protein [Planctomycetota bacterium]